MALKKKLAFVLGVSIWSFFSYGANVMPLSCRPLAKEKSPITLSPKKKGLYLLHNLTKTTVWVMRAVKKPSASAGWSSRLRPGSWSALVIAERDFVLRCIESTPGHEQVVPCENVIALCQYSKTSFPANDNGSSYWAAEDMTLPEINSNLGRRGFTLPNSQININI